MYKALLDTVEKWCMDNNLRFANLLFRIQDGKIMMIEKVEKFKPERIYDEKN